MSKYRRLTRTHRYQIERLLSLNKSAQEIADKLRVHRSTVYREIQRGKIKDGVINKKQNFKYSAREANRRFISTFRESRLGAESGKN